MRKRKNPKGLNDEKRMRNIRGGSFLFGAKYRRSALRGWRGPSIRDKWTSFRLLKVG